MKPEEIVQFAFKTQNQLRLLHWQTESFARHTAYGKIYDDLDALFDDFIEIYQGKNGRINVPQDFSISVLNINDDKISSFIKTRIDILSGSLPKALSENDTDLLNIRDEMLAQFNKLKYLLTLK